MDLRAKGQSRNITGFRDYLINSTASEHIESGKTELRKHKIQEAEIWQV